MGTRAITVIVAVLLPYWVTAAHAQEGPSASDTRMIANNDYPTVARAEYVFACTSSNGHTQDMLRRCACAIDVIAAAIPYHDYEKAETILRMRRLGGGYLAQEFRVAASTAIVEQLQEAQAEADVTCF